MEGEALKLGDTCLVKVEELAVKDPNLFSIWKK